MLSAIAGERASSAPTNVGIGLEFGQLRQKIVEHTLEDWMVIVVHGDDESSGGFNQLGQGGSDGKFDSNWITVKTK